MAIFRALSRRMFLSEIGRATIAVAIFGGLAACSDDDSALAGEDGSTTTPPKSSTSPASATSTTEPPPQATPGLEAVTWRRVSLGFVSAYVLAAAVRP